MILLFFTPYPETPEPTRPAYGIHRRPAAAERRPLINDDEEALILVLTARRWRT